MKIFLFLSKMHDFKEHCLPLLFNACLYSNQKKDLDMDCHFCRRYSKYTLGMICSIMKAHGVEFEIPYWLDIGTEYHQEERRRQQKPANILTQMRVHRYRKEKRSLRIKWIEEMEKLVAQKEEVEKKVNPIVGNWIFDRENGGWRRIREDRVYPLKLDEM